MKKVLFIICGGIASYRSIDVIRSIKAYGYSCSVILTQCAQKFISPLTFDIISGSKTFCDPFERISTFHKPLHIAITEGISLIVVIPATANIIAKSTYGLCDDMASSVLLVWNGPVVYVPSMNPLMFANKITQENITKLQSRGYEFIGPKKGTTVCCDQIQNNGHIADNEVIIQTIKSKLDKIIDNKYKGIQCVITAGPTREKIDDVRYISNLSTGQQGYSIAHAMVNSGFECHLITGCTDMIPPRTCKIYPVVSAEEMLQSVQKLQNQCDIFISAAAVSDWRVIKKYEGKKSKDDLELVLEKNSDILEHVSKWKQRPKLIIGFSLVEEEDFNSRDKHRKKMERKGCDWMLINSISALNSEISSLALMKRKEGSFTLWPIQTKEKSALCLCEEIKIFLDGEIEQ